MAEVPEIMSTYDFSAQLERIIEKRKRLDEMKAQSPELAEAIQLAEDYQAEYLELLDRYKPQFVPMPYPVYPQIGSPWPWQPWITVTTDTGTIRLPQPYQVIL